MLRRLLALALTAVGIVTGAVASATPAHADGQFEFYQIINKKSQKCLQPRSQGNMALIEQRTCSSSNTAQWWHFDVSPGTPDRYISNVWAGHCLDIQVNDVADVAPGVRVQQFSCTPASPLQRWIEPVVRVDSTGTYVQLVSRANVSMCIDIAGNSSSNGALAVMGSCWVGDLSQAFRYDRVN